VHHGLVPAGAGPDGQLVLEGHERVRDHAEGSARVESLISVAGAKYTTARAVAERITDRVMQKLGRPPVACRTATLPLPGGHVTDVRVPATTATEPGSQLDPETTAHFADAYGSRAPQIARLAAGRAEWRARVAAALPVVGAELVHAVRHEMAITLNDAVIRRTSLGAVGYPGDEAAERAAEIVAAELGWSGDRKRQEVAALRGFYASR
jgi:glycerol-3-phosphate dehydrogenase